MNKSDYLDESLKRVLGAFKDGNFITLSHEERQFVEFLGEHSDNPCERGDEMDHWAEGLKFKKEYQKE